MPPDDAVTLHINTKGYTGWKDGPVTDQAYGGWQSVRVTRGIERMPSDFELTVTERYPGQPLLLPIKPGQACVVKFGGQTVLSGWVDRVLGAIQPDGHQITILGRGRCCDLVDCSAYANNREFNNHSVLEIATAVCLPFGIVVSQRDPGTPALPNETLTAEGQVIPQYNVNLTSTAWEIIEQITRYASLLAYESESGDLLLAKPGTTVAASGFQSGVNVQAASSMMSVDQRYSTIWALGLAIDDTIQLTPGAPPDSIPNGGNILAHPTDPGVTRYRPLVIISEQTYRADDILVRRAAWEIARRYGRSQAVTIVTDTWRDSEGVIWAPNTLAMVKIPELHLDAVTWLISEVTFMADLAQGRRAQITLMPAEAFQPRPPTTLFDPTLEQAMDIPSPPPPSMKSTAGLQGRA